MIYIILLATMIVVIFKIMLNDSVNNNYNFINAIFVIYYLLQTQNKTALPFYSFISKPGYIKNKNTVYSAVKINK